MTPRPRTALAMSLLRTALRLSLAPLLATAGLVPCAVLLLLGRPAAASPFPAPGATEEGSAVLCLHDGRVVDGVPMERTEEGVKLLYENGEVLVPSELILDALLAGEDTSFVPTTEEEKEKFEKGLVPWEGRWIAIKRRNREIEKRIEERRAQIEDIRAHSLWRDRRIEETKHYRFEYTVPQHVYEDFRDLMEEYFDAFADLWRIKQPRNQGPLSVCFYGDRETFHQVSGAPGGVLGYFRFVEPYDLNVYYDHGDFDFTVAVMFHEANHYLQKLMDPEFKMPHFPGESLAEYFAACEWDPEKRKLEVGRIQEGRLTEIKDDIAAGEKLGLRKMILTDRMYEHYNWGWSFVHFMMNHGRHAKSFTKWVSALVEGKKVAQERQAFSLKTVTPEERLRSLKEHLGLKSEEDLDRLELEWHAYVDEQLDFVTARGYEEAAIAAASSYPSRPIRAKRLFGEAMKAGSTNPRAYHKYAQLLRSDGRTGEAIDLWKKAIRLDPLEAEYYAALGRALKASGKKEDGERMIALAKEMDPDARSLEFEIEFASSDGD